MSGSAAARPRAPRKDLDGFQQPPSRSPPPASRDHLPLTLGSLSPGGARPGFQDTEARASPAFSPGFSSSVGAGASSWRVKASDEHALASWGCCTCPVKTGPGRTQRCQDAQLLCLLADGCEWLALSVWKERHEISASPNGLWSPLPIYCGKPMPSSV